VSLGNKSEISCLKFEKMPSKKYIFQAYK